MARIRRHVDLNVVGVEPIPERSQLAGKGGVYCENCDIAKVTTAGDEGVRPYAVDPANDGDVAARSLPLVAGLVSSDLEWGDSNQPDRPVVLVAHGGLIAALSATLLKLPIANWPILGGMGNASWVQLSGHSDAHSVDFDSVRWRLDVWNASAQVSNDVL